MVQTVFVQAVFVQTVFVQSVFVQAVFVQTVFVQSVFVQTVFVQSVFVHSSVQSVFDNKKALYYLPLSAFLVIVVIRLAKLTDIQQIH